MIARNQKPSWDINAVVVNHGARATEKSSSLDQIGGG